MSWIGIRDILEAMRTVPRRVSPLLILLLLVAPSAGAAEFRLFPFSVPPSDFFSLSDPGSGIGLRILDLPDSYSWRSGDEQRLRIDVGIPPNELPESPPLLAPERRAEPRLFTTPTALLSAGVIVAVSLESTVPIREWGYRPFHFETENFFGPDSYAGGADKCSHFVVMANLASALVDAYDRQGHSPAQSSTLAFGMTLLSGLAIEVGDAYSPYGFSWEDLTADVLGTATGVLVRRNGLTGLIALRAGKVQTDVPVPPGYQPVLGAPSYSNEIYTADLKIAGLAGRLHFRPGLARFLLTGVTYSTKGYGYDPPLPDRERLVGFELGLNIPEILTAVGVHETTWWGSLLHKALDFFRIPFTSFGFQYDLNHGKWYGPNTGNKFN